MIECNTRQLFYLGIKKEIKESQGKTLLLLKKASPLAFTLVDY